jgi:aminoglycoside phosphotransferase (APT) family kinase protein
MSLPVIDEGLVRRLLSDQFPQWTGLHVRPIEPGGWDNKTFRLGDRMIVRLPRAADYAAQVEKEHRWLPRLAPSLPYRIPEPLAIGQPGSGYPWKWSVYRWIEGESAAPERIADLTAFACSVARFLVALQRTECANGPLPGPHNFHRGGPLAIYDAETRQAIAVLESKIDVRTAIAVWDEALESSWSRSPVWVHGDVSAGNLLLQEGRLSAVIDFGMLGVGDPACDLSIAWTLFSGKSRETFRAVLRYDSGTWARGRGWALWKAMIVAAGLTETNAVEAAQCWRVIGDVLEERRDVKSAESLK